METIARQEGATAKINALEKRLRKRLSRLIDQLKMSVPNLP
jgi:hypothetical protein